VAVHHIGNDDVRIVESLHASSRLLPFIEIWPDKAKIFIHRISCPAAATKRSGEIVALTAASVNHGQVPKENKSLHRSHRDWMGIYCQFRSSDIFA
jgi:hypothetical protein